MTSHTLPQSTLDAMRAMARAFVAQAPRVAARGQVNAKADGLVSEALMIAFPGCSVHQRAAMMGVEPKDVTAVPAQVRMRAWWSDDLVAELAALAAPRRARLAMLFLHSGAGRQATRSLPHPGRLALWGGEVRV